MNKKYQKIGTRAGLLGAIGASLVLGLAAIPQETVAQGPFAAVNPCPSIYYEEPHNNRVMVPEGCAPNAYTQRMAAQGITPIRSTQRPQTLTPQRIAPAAAPTTPAQIVPAPAQPGVGVMGVRPGINPPGTATTLPVQPPLPEVRSEPIAMVMPQDGKVDVKLVNNTNAVVAYEAIEYTERRYLQGGESIVLQDLPTPVTVTMVREDRGLLDVIPVKQQEPGMVVLSLDESQSLDDNQGVIRVSSEGAVYLN